LQNNKKEKKMNTRQRVVMAQRDLLIKDLAILLDRSSAHISSVMAGRFESPEMRRKISLILGKPEDFLWPPDGTESK
jgi:hypothetical protein